MNRFIAIGDEGCVYKVLKENCIKTLWTVLPNKKEARKYADKLNLNRGW